MTGESGAIGLLAAAVAALAIVFALLVGDLARVVVVRSQVTTAADAAALAAAPVTFAAFGTSGDPVREASAVAVANDAELVECRCLVDRSWNSRTVTAKVATTVSLKLLGSREVAATSSAEFRPVALGQP